ncbi:MAG: DUF4147 domain-containing protein [Nitrososphaerota archaeon]
MEGLVKNSAELMRLFREREQVAVDLLRLVEAGLAAVEPRSLTRRKVVLKNNLLAVDGFSLDLGGFRSVWVIAVGKAAPGMARGLMDVLGGRVDKCVVVAPRGSDLSMIGGSLHVYLSSHPIPDESGLRASEALLEMLKDVSKDTLIIFLVSGGASSLLPAPAEGVSLSDKAEATRLLLSSGATIEELNIVRKHLSSVKGGQLARAMSPARVLSLILSDVPGDKLEVIGSGPTLPDPSTFRDAYEVLVRRNVWTDLPRAVRERIEAGVAGRLEETPKPGDPLFERVTNVLIGSVGDALEAVVEAGSRLGYRGLILSRCFEGEASSLGLLFGTMALELERRPGELFALGGESTVNVRGRGRGGRNQELALAALTRLKEGCRNIVASFGTDGVDGPTDAAGGVACSEQLAIIRSLGLNPRDYLETNDSYTFFKKVGGHIVTGPTGTNVGDVVLILSPKN